jgi:hypothetical protein
VLVFTSDCTWGCLVGLKEWWRRSRLMDVNETYKKSVSQSTDSIRNMYNNSLLNFNGVKEHEVTIRDEEKRNILKLRFNGPDDGSHEELNKFWCPNIKPIFDTVKENYGKSNVDPESFRGIWRLPSPYDKGKALAIWLPFWAYKDVRPRCPRCRVVFQFDMVDERDDLVDWLETVYPGTPWSCAEVMAMFELGGTEYAVAADTSHWDCS